MLDPSRSGYSPVLGTCFEEGSTFWECRLLGLVGEIERLSGEDQALVHSARLAGRSGLVVRHAAAARLPISLERLLGLGWGRSVASYSELLLRCSSRGVGAGEVAAEEMNRQAAGEAGQRRFANGVGP